MIFKAGSDNPNAPSLDVFGRNFEYIQKIILQECYVYQSTTFVRAEMIHVERMAK
jgi:hypothetical protein